MLLHLLASLQDPSYILIELPEVPKIIIIVLPIQWWEVLTSKRLVSKEDL